MQCELTASFGLSIPLTMKNLTGANGTSTDLVEPSI
jgi:hypothetical protein